MELFLCFHVVNETFTKLKIMLYIVDKYIIILKFAMYFAHI